MPTTDLHAEIPQAGEADPGARVVDLHVWQWAAGQWAAIVASAARAPRSLSYGHEVFRQHEELLHVTVEIQPLEDPRAAAPERPPG